MANAVAKRIVIVFLVTASAIVLSIAGMLVGAIIGSGNAHGSVVTCPVTGAGAPIRCIMVPAGHVGQQITDKPGAGCHDTSWMITDSSGAPEAWVNCYGLYVGGVTGMVGGQICITEGLSQAFCLTKADIEWLHSQDGAPNNGNRSVHP